MAKISVKNVTINGVSSPSSIMLIAQERGIDPSEVFVRISFNYNDNEIKASNKLKYLKKIGYEKLVKAVETATPIDLLYDAENSYFDIDYGYTVDSLFSNSTVTDKPKNSESKPKSILTAALSKVDEIIGG